jgi:hypothetical protein
MIFFCTLGAPSNDKFLLQVGKFRLGAGITTCTELPVLVNDLQNQVWEINSALN